MSPTLDAAAVLGLPADATRAEVLRRFRAVARETHPDGGGCGDLGRLAWARDVLLERRDESEALRPRRFVGTRRVSLLRTLRRRARTGVSGRRHRRPGETAPTARRA